MPSSMPAASRLSTGRSSAAYSAVNQGSLYPRSQFPARIHDAISTGVALYSLRSHRTDCNTEHTLVLLYNVQFHYNYNWFRS